MRCSRFNDAKDGVGANLAENFVTRRTANPVSLRLHKTRHRDDSSIKSVQFRTFTVVPRTYVQPRNVSPFNVQCVGQRDRHQQQYVACLLAASSDEGDLLKSELYNGPPAGRPSSTLKFARPPRHRRAPNREGTLLEYRLNPSK